MIAVTLALELLLMTMVGFFARKRGIVNETFAGQLTNFVMRITLPMLIFHSVRSSVEFTPEALRDCGVAIAAGFFVMAISLGIGQIHTLRGQILVVGNMDRTAVTKFDRSLAASLSGSRRTDDRSPFIFLKCRCEILCCTEGIFIYKDLHDHLQTDIIGFLDGLLAGTVNRYENLTGRKHIVHNLDQF